MLNLLPIKESFASTPPPLFDNKIQKDFQSQFVNLDYHRKILKFITND